MKILRYFHFRSLIDELSLYYIYVLSINILMRLNWMYLNSSTYNVNEINISFRLAKIDKTSRVRVWSNFGNRSFHVRTSPDALGLAEVYCHIQNDIQSFRPGNWSTLRQFNSLSPFDLASGQGYAIPQTWIISLRWFESNEWSRITARTTWGGGY